MTEKKLIEAIVTDIEGTTTSLSFVKDTLFPHAKKELPSYIKEHLHEPQIVTFLESVQNTLASELGHSDPSLDLQISTLLSWIEEDRKHPALKGLQGLIWEKGYQDKKYVGHLYEDVPKFLNHVSLKNNLRLYVYSSGSVHAQKLLFAHTKWGDLTSYFSGYFDTHIGMKKNTASYEAIAKEITCSPEKILFLSDAWEELDAARQAGWQTTQIIREGVSPRDGHLHITTLDELEQYFKIGS